MPLQSLEPYTQATIMDLHVCCQPIILLETTDFNAGLEYRGEGHGGGFVVFHYVAFLSCGFSFDEAPDKTTSLARRQAEGHASRQLPQNVPAGNASKRPHAWVSEPLRAFGFFPRDWTSEGPPPRTWTLCGFFPPGWISFGFFPLHKSLLWLFGFLGILWQTTLTASRALFFGAFPPKIGCHPVSSKGRSFVTLPHSHRNGFICFLLLWTLLLGTLHPVGSVAAGSRHGRPLEPRDAKDRKRAELRTDLELPQGRPVLPVTQKQRDRLLSLFDAWLHDQGWEP